MGGGMMSVFQVQESPPWLLLICGFLSIVALLLITTNRSPNRNAFPPGPFAWPVIGHLHLLTELPHQALRDMAQKYGPIVGLRLGQQLAVAISSPELAKEVLHTHDKIFANRPPAEFNELLLYGQNSDIIFSAQCPQWRKQRKICTVGLFTTKRLQELEYVRQQEVARLLQRLQEESAGARQAVDIGHCMGEMSSHVIMRLLQSEGSAHAGAESLHKLVKELEHEVSIPTLRDLIPTLSLLDFARKRRMRRLHDRIHAALAEVLGHRKQSNSSYDDLLQSLLTKEVDNANGTMKNSIQDTLTPNEINCILLDMIAAGIHTTTLTLEWTMAELLRNPHCLDRLHREVDAAFGTTGEKMQKIISDADIPKLSYLKCVVKEVARLHPVLPMLVPRISTAECKIKGYTIPARTMMFVNVWAIGRDEQVWSKAGEFRPERFEEEAQEVDLRGQHYELLPFGSGRRICLGLPLALSIVEVTLANLVYRFDWQLPPGVTPSSVDMLEKGGISNNKATPTLAIPKPRNLM
ncbi:hypothetical protein GOP47_0011867 [Adiantum capillus-veneris]|uniref:Cytochrome P450 n=1 Tax=Adiantum capillus-veneris TaxID=13818 RepID=A0A9D4ZFS9_ADICA|nr:hypothetical protein GOP47_0011867 [Adiantum capillus-veneris]